MNTINNELYEKLTRLQWLLHKTNLRNQIKRGPMSDPTRGQGRIIAILKLQDGISTKDLSYLLGIRVSSLNELLAKMEKNGYILREPSEADRRVILVKLTEKGRNEPQQELDPYDIFACLSEEEQMTFGEYLDRMIAALETKAGDQPEENEREEWFNNMRERMGDEAVERFAQLKRGFFGGGPRHEGPGHEGPRHEGPRHGGPGHGGPGHEGPGFEGPGCGGPGCVDPRDWHEVPPEHCHPSEEYDPEME